ncbi:NAD(P)H-dependent oxidoreductase [Paraflavitalea speifideaquila]|uniref:NAD(P)H-dependent oxidoreductase n=1 Tax=Paraflavitalea speifideaquila TaxID=3076558 RepID=UPI0028EFE85A|nr:NAD(P)H-dependent oxidoreductase [Paraflavitalea speifideiaquila]
MGINPVSGSQNCTRLRNTTFFKQQLEELHATETGSFAADVEAEGLKVEWCDLMIWQFPLWWFTMPGIYVLPPQIVYGPARYPLNSGRRNRIRGKPGCSRYLKNSPLK